MTACSKVRHRSRDAAIITAKRLRIASLVPYECPTCHRWHLGNSKDMAAARIDQLLAEARDRDRRARAPERP